MTKDNMGNILAPFAASNSGVLLFISDQQTGTTTIVHNLFLTIQRRLVSK